MTAQEKIEILQKRIEHRKEWLKRAYLDRLGEVEDWKEHQENLNVEDAAEIARIEREGK